MCQEGPCWDQGSLCQQWAQHSTCPSQVQQQHPTQSASSQPQFWPTWAWAHWFPLQSSTGCCWPQWWGGCGGLGEHWRPWQRLCGGGKQWWWVRFRQWLTWECCWLWSQVSNQELPHVFRYWGGSLWHHTVWGSNYEVIKTEWDLTLKEDHSSFELNKMIVRTDQLLQINEATHVWILPHEPEAEVHRRKKTLVQSLKQFHAHFYQLYEKGMTHTMVSLQGLHSGNAFRCPNVSTDVGLHSFCPWCLKLGGHTETIAIHLWEVHYRMRIMCNIWLKFTGMTAQSILDHSSGWKVKCDRECMECEGHEKAQKSHKKKKKSQGQKEVSQPLGSDAAKKSWWVECHSISSSLSPSPTDEQMSVHLLNHSRSLCIHFRASPF